MRAIVSQSCAELKVLKEGERFEIAFEYAELYGVLTCVSVEGRVAVGPMFGHFKRVIDVSGGGTPFCALVNGSDCYGGEHIPIFFRIHHHYHFTKGEWCYGRNAHMYVHTTS